jgi:Na+-transporting NADH:ubiquinone oxidoreductase subunit NqrC
MKAGIVIMKKQIFVVSLALVLLLVVAGFVFALKSPVAPEAVTLEMENEATILRIATLLAPEDEVAKAIYLEDLRRGLQDFSPLEIKEHLAELEASITEYIEHYENRSQEQLLTKDELYVQQHRDEVKLSPEELAALKRQTGKSEEQLLLEELNPRLKEYSAGDYYYDEAAKEFVFTLDKG